MKTHISLFFLLVILLLVSCEKEETPKPLPEAGYPTTYNVLSQSEWEAVNAEFQKITSYDGLSINAFGFVEGEVVLDANDSVTVDFVIETIENLIEIYKGYMGIPEGTQINVGYEIITPIPFLAPGGSTDIYSYFEMLDDLRDEEWVDVSDELNIHSVSLFQNILNDRKLKWAFLSFVFYEEENKVIVGGNWWPEALVTSSEIYSEEEAYQIALDRISEEHGINVKKKETERSITRELYVNRNNSNVEIRECWYAYIKIGEDSFNHVYIDTQTGEVITYQEHGWLM
ncbi:hypothetical protein [uncultured Draconibacterium sp.]|uniref:hypothetical protein n=1 Tax=uncultured Draconibacterium sp. TaxID=1573823 RepID=UPI003217918F